jgi:integrase
VDNQYKDDPVAAISRSGRLLQEVRARLPGHTDPQRTTLLKGNGKDVKVVQELLRHSTAKMTLDTNTQALSAQKRAAQSQFSS